MLNHWFLFFHFLWSQFESFLGQKLSLTSLVSLLIFKLPVIGAYCVSSAALMSLCSTGTTLILTAPVCSRWHSPHFTGIPKDAHALISGRAGV